MQFFSPGWRRTSIAALLAMSVTLGGCASTGSGLLGSRSPVDPRLTTNDDAAFFSKSGFQACASAAAVGVAACLLSGSSNKATCAIVAGIAACGIAMGTNYYLDYRRSQYNTTAEMLDAVTSDVEKDTQRLQERSVTLQEVIESDKQKLAKIQFDMAQQKLDAATAKKQLEGVDADIAHMRNEIDNIDNRIAAYREAAASAEKAKERRALDTQIEKLQAEATKLHSAMGSLTAQRDSLDWGKQA